MFIDDCNLTTSNLIIIPILFTISFTLVGCGTNESYPTKNENSQPNSLQTETLPTQAQVNVATNNKNCRIKGNISEDGTKIFHNPNCPYFHKTIIEESNGERWFCTEEEAGVAGWRRSYDCPGSSSNLSEVDKECEALHGPSTYKTSQHNAINMGSWCDCKPGYELTLTDDGLSSWCVRQ